MEDPDGSHGKPSQQRSRTTITQQPQFGIGDREEKATGTKQAATGNPAIKESRSLNREQSISTGKQPGATGTTKAKRKPKRQGGNREIIFLLRLVPLLPFNMLNYLLSVTPVGIWEYIMASWLGMMLNRARCGLVKLGSEHFKKQKLKISYKKLPCANYSCHELNEGKT
ncbi:hypothetical protein MA16_Dca020865 [Dendrobium catenatum]|uniref:Uncharacterized protein n=1 Tax=Dendrobium catenatum TaxID=906689 RepID=A0A2I0X6V4_9ASPA|nr:hypothetical protein MA16_Dca020865 [Dendrobium catenatum]